LTHLDGRAQLQLRMAVRLPFPIPVFERAREHRVFGSL